MVKKIVIAGAAAAAILGAGTAALAASGSSPSNGSTSAGSTSAGAGNAGAGNAGKAGANRHPGLDLARRALHATWVTRNGTSGFVTHDAIRGQVTAVSADSITVKAADDVSQTYAVTGDTKVHVRADGKGKAGSIGEVKTGDRVVVLGTGTTSLTATQVLDGAK